jgi:hypothetical protein
MKQCQDLTAESCAACEGSGGPSQGGSCHGQRLGQRLEIPLQTIGIAYYPAAFFLIVFTTVLAILACIFFPPTFLPLDLRLVPIKINWRGPQPVAILSRFRSAKNGVAASSVATVSVATVSVDTSSACSAQGGLDPFVTATTATATATLPDGHDNATYPSPATSSLFSHIIRPIQATKSLTLYPPADVPTSTINPNAASPSSSTPSTCTLAALFD